MFCYQRNFTCQCETISTDDFTRLVTSDEVLTRIKGYRLQAAERSRLKQELATTRTLLEANADPALPMNGELKGRMQELAQKLRDIDRLKSGLPTLMYQCSRFDETTSRNGRRGHWRKQAAARLNGLFMLDVDHVDNPRAMIQAWVDGYVKDNEEDLPADAAMQRAAFCHSLGIVLMHITPSGRGLRIVAVADAATGNLADNQARLAGLLGVEADEACKDATRCSFCPGLDDIIFINKEKLFNYENPEYDEKFGPQYRGGHSEPLCADRKNGAGTAGSGVGAADGGTEPADETTGTAAAVDRRAQGAAADVDELLGKGYHGVSYEKIIDKWFDLVSKGRPVAGDRHRTLLRLAGDLRYIADNNPKLLERLLQLSDTGRQLLDEGCGDEIARIADCACGRHMWASIPQRFCQVLQAAGVQLSGGAADHEAEKAAAIDYDRWWRRLEPLLGGDPLLQACVAPLPDHLKLAGVLAAGAMLGTYLTRCWWEHFDGKDYRLSFLVYIIGDAASGKSFVTEFDRLLMAPMLAADRVGREWERQYKEEMKKRAASSKNAKMEAPEQQHPVIRYVPSTVSNAMLYRRLTDAIDNNAIGPDQQPMHLHCYTMEPELATALRAQQGSWAGKNDLELKSFHNEYAGVDYANDQSVNGIIQVNWNQVVTGTWESMARKIRPAMVLDGLVTRLTLFPMPRNDYQMIARTKAIRNHEREELMRSAGLKLEQMRGELKAERLVDFCYDYECQLTDSARLEQDECLDYFRKRIPVIMMRYALVRLVLRHPEEALQGLPLPVDDSDLQYARIIGDWALMAQMHLFGQMVMEARQMEKQHFVPRRRTEKVRNAFDSLPREFDAIALVKAGLCRDGNHASTTLRRWAKDGLVEQHEKIWKKLVMRIP